MFKKSDDLIKNITVNHKSHTQKKYFSLMIVPSHTTGKTRSVKIPYGMFYFVIISVLLISATVFGFYMRASYFERAAQQAEASLNEAQEAYVELHTNLEEEQSRLVDGQNQLKEQLTEAEIEKQTEISRQTQAYQDNLTGLQEQVEEIERQLQELDNYRQEKLDKLELKAYIPPVNNLLERIDDSSAVSLSYLQTAIISSDERSYSARVSEDDLQDYFAIFALKKEAVEQDFIELEDTVKKAVPYINNYPTLRPVSVGSVSSGFGYRKDPMGGRNRDYNDAIDIRCPTGTDVVATGGGIVTTSRWSGSYGYFIVIDHGFGMQTAYAHNSKLLVKVGDKVDRGDVIAKSGNTGNSTGPHIHYEVRENGVTKNPANFFLE